MDDYYRLKIKIGPHEFEAEGPSDVVREQFQAFKEMVSMTPLSHAPITQPPQVDPQVTLPPPLPPQDGAINAESLGNIIKKDGRIVSLTVKPKAVEDAIMVILLAQKVCLQTDWVTGAQIMDGLVTTGGYAVGRIDRFMEKLAEAGDAIVTGEHRGKRYRMTNTGLTRSQKIATDLLALVV
jgi:hypothetical protein